MTGSRSKRRFRPALTRRRFGALLSVGLVALTLERFCWKGNRERSAVSSRLRRLHAPSISARTVGRTLLSNRAVIQDHDGLTDALLTRLDLDDATALTMAEGDLRRMIAACIRDDFAKGSIVAADGWIFSQTEAQLCALASLGTG